MNPAVSPLCGVDELDTPFRLKMLGRFRGDEELFDIATAIEATSAGDPELARPLSDLKKLDHASPELRSIATSPTKAG